MPFTLEPLDLEGSVAREATKLGIACRISSFSRSQVWTLALDLGLKELGIICLAGNRGGKAGNRQLKPGIRCILMHFLLTTSSCRVGWI